MKKTKKRVLGFLGLFLVAAITTFAALMPPLRTSAVGSASAQDQIKVRVVGAVPKVTFTRPASGSRFTEPDQTVSINYENVSDLVVMIEYKDAEGNTQSQQLDRIDNIDYHPGAKDYQLNLDDLYGFGEYTIRVKGNGFGENNISEDVITFTYHSFEPNVPGGDNGPGSSEDNPLTGNPEVDFNVDPNDQHIYRLEVDVYSVDHKYDTDGDLIEELSHQEVTSPFNPLVLEFQEHGLPSGWYMVEVQAYDAEGNPFDEPERLWFYYYVVEPAVVPNAGAPDSGGLFANLNISRQDYLITGMIIFGVAALIGVALVIRRKATAKRRK